MAFLYLNYREHDVLWGEVTHSIPFHQVRKYLLRMDERHQSHSKLWRPSVLLIVDDFNPAIFDFCNSLKKGGLYVVGIPLVGEIGQLSDDTVNFRNEWVQLIKGAGLKAFPTMAVGSNVRDLYYNLALNSGLGALKVNIVVMTLYGSIEQT